MLRQETKMSFKKYSNYGLPCDFLQNKLTIMTFHATLHILIKKLRSQPGHFPEVPA